jgi:hypothetical protein
MKYTHKITIAGIALVLGLVITFIVVANGNKGINVRDIGTDPAAFTGTLTITGITYAFSPQDNSIFGIVDVKELQCTTPNCNKLIIPVRYQGKLPKTGDEIRVSGEFVNDGGGYLFSANELKIVRNHKLGGQLQ